MAKMLSWKPFGSLLDPLGGGLGTSGSLLEAPGSGLGSSLKDLGGSGWVVKGSWKPPGCSRMALGESCPLS